jgi:membrane protein implicated in regulation of membrane protease activity
MFDIYFSIVNISFFWLMLGGLLLILELFLINSIYLLFSVAGAFILSVLLQFNYIKNSDIFLQLFVFSVISAICSLVFYYNRKNIAANNVPFDNLIGNEVQVIADSFNDNIIGKVKWSGTIMNAKIANGSYLNSSNDAKYVIINIEGNILIIGEKK